MLLLVKTENQFDQLIADLWTCTIAAVDTESTGLQPYHGSEIIGISFWFPEMDRGYYVPLNHVDFMPPRKWWDWLREAYPLHHVTYVFHNAMFDLHMLHNARFRDPHKVEDTMIAAQLVNENENNRQLYPDGSYRLKYLAVKYLGAWAGEGEEVLKAEAKKLGLDPKKEMWKMPVDKVWFYAAMDTKITWLLREFYRPHLEEWHQWELYQRRNTSLLVGYYPMARDGMLVDSDLLMYLINDSRDRLAEHYDHIVKYVADRTGMVDFNPDSPRQVKTVLGMLGTAVKDTSFDTLEALEGNELASLVIEYRKIAKELRNYYEPYMDMLDENDRLHVDTYMIGTVTGRVSSRLQQMPNKKGYDVKRVFVPPPGWVMVQADYSNLELRLASHFAQEPTMTRLFVEDTDLHRYTADRIIEQMGYSLVNPEDYEDEAAYRKAERHLMGKTPNFSFLYGMSPFRSVPTQRSKAEIRFKLHYSDIIPIWRGWHTTYSNFSKAFTAAKELASRARPNPSGNGSYHYLRLFNGRTRKFSPWIARNLSPPTKDALNFLIQGTGAAMTEESLTRVGEIADPDEIRLALQVHDSIIFYVREDVLDKWIPRVVEIMEDFPEFHPPIKVDVEVSKHSWADLKKV